VTPVPPAADAVKHCRHGNDDGSQVWAAFTFLQKLYASSSRRSDVPELLKKKHSKLQARSGGGGHDDMDDTDDDEDDEAEDTEDEVLTDTNEDEMIDLKPKNSGKRKSDESSADASPTKKTKTEVR